MKKRLVTWERYSVAVDDCPMYTAAAGPLDESLAEMVAIYQTINPASIITVERQTHSALLNEATAKMFDAGVPA